MFGLSGCLCCGADSLCAVAPRDSFVAAGMWRDLTLGSAVALCVSCAAGAFVLSPGVLLKITH